MRSIALARLGGAIFGNGWWASVGARRLPGAEASAEREKERREGVELGPASDELVLLSVVVITGRRRVRSEVAIVAAAGACWSRSRLRRGRAKVAAAAADGPLTLHHSQCIHAAYLTAQSTALPLPPPLDHLSPP